MELKTTSDVLRRLKLECKKSRSMAKWAKAHGFSRGYISKVLLGKRELTNNLYSALGFVAIPLYARKDEVVTESSIKEWARNLTESEEWEIVEDARQNVTCNRCNYYTHHCQCLNGNEPNK